MAKTELNFFTKIYAPSQEMAPQSCQHSTQTLGVSFDSSHVLLSYNQANYKFYLEIIF